MSAPPRWVEGYLSIAFVDKGRTERGCDCFGLVRLVLARQKVLILADYGFVAVRDRSSINEQITTAMANRDQWCPVSLSEAQAFDVVVMTATVTDQDWHVGIMVTERHVLHTEFASGPVCVDVSHSSVVHRLHPQNAPLVYRHRDLCK